MKLAAAAFALLTAGPLSPACADPPDTPAAPAPESAAATPAAPESATTPATPAAAAAKPAPASGDERMQEALLRYQGYRLSMVRGEEKWCRREVPLGSHLPTVMRCITAQEAEEMAREGRWTTEHVQRNQTACLTPAAGGCGK